MTQHISNYNNKREKDSTYDSLVGDLEKIKQDKMATTQITANMKKPIPTSKTGPAMLNVINNE